MKPKVSIIIPIYNRENFVAQMCESILSQTFEDYEVIIVDDGSVDATEEAIKNSSLYKTGKIKLLKQENSGPAAARNLGFSVSNGAYIAFFDSDDVWLPHHLEKIISLFTSNPEADLIYAACTRRKFKDKTTLVHSTFYTNGEKNKLFDVSDSVGEGFFKIRNEEAIDIQICTGIDCGLQNSVFKRSLLEEELLPNFRIGEDRLFFVRELLRGKNFFFLDSVHVIYNVHEGNTSDTNNEIFDIEKKVKTNLILIDSYKYMLAEFKLTREN